MRQLTLTCFLFLASVVTTLAQDKCLDQGNEFINNEQFDKAEQTFREGIKSNPTNLVYQCQLGYALIGQKKYAEGEQVLDKVLKKDSNNVGAYWYSGIGNFYAAKDREAIKRFEKTLTILDKKSGQYYSAHWFIGSCYSNLLKTTGITYAETDRMFACYEVYLKLQPNAQDAPKIRDYVDRKKKRRPAKNVEMWVDL